MMSLFEDTGPQEFEDMVLRLRDYQIMWKIYRDRIEKALSIIDRCEEVCDYSGDTISDLREALEGEYDA